MQAEAEKLAKASFGETLLHALGRAYDNHASVALGNVFTGAAAKLRQHGDSIR